MTDGDHKSARAHCEEGGSGCSPSRAPVSWWSSYVLLCDHYLRGVLLPIARDRYCCQARASHHSPLTTVSVPWKSHVLWP